MRPDPWDDGQTGAPEPPRAGPGLVAQLIAGFVVGWALAWLAVITWQARPAQLPADWPGWPTITAIYARATAEAQARAPSATPTADPRLQVLPGVYSSNPTPNQPQNRRSIP